MDNQEDLFDDKNADDSALHVVKNVDYLEKFWIHFQTICLVASAKIN